MLLLFISIFFALVILNIFARPSAHALFQKSFVDIKMPICIIDHTGKITWQNKQFQEIFKITDTNFESQFKPKQVLNQIQVVRGQDAWSIKHIKLGKSFGVVFQPMKKEMLNWWESIPFPIGILGENNQIEECNFSLKNILTTDAVKKPITEFAPQFDIKKAQQIRGQELVWHSKIGMLPVVTWAKPYADKKLLILENRAEFIKLKNKAQEAQHLQIMGQLACSIIHDFNNLLTAISGFSEVLETSIPKNEMLTEIKRNTQQAAELAKELLNFVKKKPSEHHSCELATFLRSRKTMLQKLLGSHIKLEITANYDGWIELSQTQIEQIILNLAINSKDAMGYSLNEDDEYKPHNPKVNSFIVIQHKKHIAVKTTINNTTIEPGDYFVIEVADTGKGISKENMSKIFSPFFSTKAKGTGLGLASCLRIVQHAGGTIDFSTSALGTKFFIYLPIVLSKINSSNTTNESAEQKTTKKTLADKASQSSNKIHIMIAEDEEVIRNLTQKSLMQAGYNVTAFSNGQDAFEAMLANPNINILLTDAVLPGIDGVVLASKAQQLNPEIKVLIVSGYSYDDLAPNIKNTIQNLNHIYYLGKPFTLKALKEKVIEIASCK